MAAVSSTTNAINEVFDDNFSDFEDPFADNVPLPEPRDDKPTLSPRATKRKVDAEQDNFGLGLDEEVRILKKRKPVAKLDEARLLSEPGLPKIRALIRSKKIGRTLRLKGKGHEYDDTAKLLNYFQLWLDNLYPRAKFADALQMVEKAGHTKRMQTMRCEWIDEGKPGFKPPDVRDLTHGEPDLFGESDHDASDQVNNITRPNDGSAQLDSLFFPDAGRQIENEIHGDPDDNELEALLMQENNPSTAPKPTRSTDRVVDDDSEGDDDLDALLAEQEQSRLQNISPDSRNDAADPGETAPDGWEEDMDELEVLLAEDNDAPCTKHTDQRGSVESFASRTIYLRAAAEHHNSNCELDEGDVPISRSTEKEPNNATRDDGTLMLENDILSSSPVRQSLGGIGMPEHANLPLPYWGTEPVSAHTRITPRTQDDSVTNTDAASDGIELETDLLSSSPIDTTL